MYVVQESSRQACFPCERDSWDRQRSAWLLLLIPRGPRAHERDHSIPSYVYPSGGTHRIPSSSLSMSHFAAEKVAEAQLDIEEGVSILLAASLSGGGAACAAHHPCLSHMFFRLLLFPSRSDAAVAVGNESLVFGYRFLAGKTGAFLHRLLSLHYMSSPATLRYCCSPASPCIVIELWTDEGASV